MVPTEEIRTWVFNALLPFWAEHGVDREYGGFLEELAPNGAPTAHRFKRVRTMCRQTYAFSHAALLGYPGAAALSELGWRYLRAHARLDGGAWAKVLTRAGAVHDARPDLYDLAFVLFALAWRCRLAREAEVKADLVRTLDFIQQRMRDGEGFVPILPDEGVRLQNPHMHLTEACLAAYEATADERFLDQARELVALFRRRLFDGACLWESFDASWRRTDLLPPEPGHHFEWAWILAQYQRLAGESMAVEAQALVAWAERHGVDARSGAVFDAVDDTGAPLRTSSRAWTNTERIKAWVGLFEMTGRDPRPAITQSVRLLFDRYFLREAPGAWVDQFDENGAPMVEAVPASIVYHLLLAFSEVLRIAPRLAAFDYAP